MQSNGQPQTYQQDTPVVANQSSSFPTTLTFYPKPCVPPPCCAKYTGSFLYITNGAQDVYLPSLTNQQANTWITRMWTWITRMW